MPGNTVRWLVAERAGHQCEYCLSRQDSEPFFRYPIDHCIARQHGGSNDPENLALACPHCNFHKGPNIAGLDPDTGSLTRLFNPRRDIWADHFVARQGKIIGRTPIGSATISVLAMNDPLRVELRLASTEP